MRIRTIKPEFWRNRKLASLGREVHDFAARLITASDDEGYAEADPALLAGDLYPFDSDAQRFIKRALPELERIGFIQLAGGEHGVLRLPGFRDHQRINRPSPSRLKPRFVQAAVFHEFSEPSVSPHGALSEPSPTEGEGEREVEQGKGTGKGKGNVVALAPREPDPDALGDVWNIDTSPPLPKVTLPLTKGRKTHAEQALARRPLPEWRQVFQRINASSFLRGADGGWKADFDWAIRAEGKKPETAMKVLEGAYDRTATGPPSQRREEPADRPQGAIRL